MADQVVCPYCDKPAEKVSGKVIYPHRRDLSAKRFYLCRRCEAYVGCHKDSGRPFGGLANKELRDARQAAHAQFDSLWQRQWQDANGKWHQPMSRGAAYSWLAKVMGLHKSKAHIGDFDVEQCRKVVLLVNEFRQNRIGAEVQHG